MLKALKKGFATTHNQTIVIMMADLSDNPKDIDTDGVADRIRGTIWCARLAT